MERDGWDGIISVAGAWISWGLIFAGVVVVGFVLLTSCGFRWEGNFRLDLVPGARV